MNQGKEKKTWLPFIYGCFAGLVTWVVIFVYLSKAASKDMPGFVWGILFAYLFFFNTFPINMYC